MLDCFCDLGWLDFFWVMFDEVEEGCYLFVEKGVVVIGGYVVCVDCVFGLVNEGFGLV